MQAITYSSNDCVTTTAGATFCFQCSLESIPFGAQRVQDSLQASVDYKSRPNKNNLLKNNVKYSHLILENHS